MALALMKLHVIICCVDIQHLHISLYEKRMHALETCAHF